MKKIAAAVMAALAVLQIAGCSLSEVEYDTVSRSMPSEDTAVIPDEVGLTETEAETEAWIEMAAEPETVIEPEPEFEQETEAETEQKVVSVLITEVPVIETDVVRFEPAEEIPADDDSGMTAERIAELTGVAVFWAPTGKKMHCKPDCSSFKRGYAYAGTLEQAKTVRSEGWCGICSKGVTDYNYLDRIQASAANLARCHTYEEFCAGIPAEAFQ